MGGGVTVPKGGKCRELLKLSMPPASPAHATHGREAGRADLGVLVAVLCKSCSLRDWVDVPVIATVCRQAQIQSADAPSTSHRKHPWQNIAVHSLSDEEKRHQHMALF